IFSYVRWQNRTDPRWEKEVRTLFVERQAGRAPRPPRTLTEQTTVVNKLSANPSTAVHVKNLVVVTTPEQVIPKQKLKAVAAAEREQVQKQVHQERTAQQQRQKIEVQALSKGQVPARAGDPPRSAKL